MANKPELRSIGSIILWAILCGAGACIGLAVSYDPSDSIRRYVECFAVVTIIGLGLDLLRRWSNRRPTNTTR